MSHSNKIGDDRGAKGRAAASQIRRKQADARAADLAPIIARFRASGVTSLYGIAKALTALAVPTPNGRKKMAGITGPAGVGAEQPGLDGGESESNLVEERQEKWHAADAETGEDSSCR